MMFKCTHLMMKKWSLEEKMNRNIKAEEDRHYFFTLLLKLVALSDRLNLRLIIENPYNTSRMTFLQNNFPDPSLIDNNRAKRGDYYVKPTAYWFFNCEHTFGMSYQINKHPKIVYKQKGAKQVTGQCDEQRSLISPDYARNFICDFIIGKQQKHTQLTLF